MRFLEFVEAFARVAEKTMHTYTKDIIAHQTDPTLPKNNLNQSYKDRYVSEMPSGNKSQMGGASGRVSGRATPIEFNERAYESNDISDRSAGSEMKRTTNAAKRTMFRMNDNNITIQVDFSEDMSGTNKE